MCYNFFKKIKMKKLIKKFFKKQDRKILHKLRIQARKELSILENRGKTDLGLVNLLINSSKLRDTDVLIKICKNRKIKKYLKKRRKKLLKKFLNFLKYFKREIILYEKEDIKVDLKKCKEILNESFINKDDKILHKIRIFVKRCRYNFAEYEKILKKIQDDLGLAHDYYKCEKLLRKFGLDYKKTLNKKIKFIEKAEAKRIKFDI